MVGTVKHVKALKYFFTESSKAVLLLWILFCNLCFVFSLSFCHVCTLQLCGHLREMSDLLAILCVMFFVILSLCLMVSRVMCGTWSYRFLIFDFFLTLTRMESGFFT